MDSLIGAAEEFPEFMQTHGSTFCLIGAAALFLVSYTLWHIIERRRFYRRKRADPFPTYRGAWWSDLVEGNLRILAFLAMGFAVLVFIAGIIDHFD